MQKDVEDVEDEVRGFRFCEACLVRRQSVLTTYCQSDIGPVLLSKAGANELY